MQNFTIQLPENVKRIIDTIEQNGFAAYAVGGCVRDSVLQREPDDWDITTSAVPNQVKTFFKKTIDTGIKHGTVTVMLDGIGYEVTTYRIDGEYKDGRHPESVEFSVRLSDDLMRRDFTINAMAYNDKDGLIDEFDGLQDLERKVIRCVGKAEERFTEDALRMMRAIRFSAQLGFEIEMNTFAAIRKLAPAIAKVSMERIQVELVKTLMSDHPEYVKLYDDTGLLQHILPDMHRILAGKYAKNALAMVRYANKTPVLKYAALLNMMEPKEAELTLRTLKLDNYTINTVTKLVRYSKEIIEENEPAVREAVHKYGKEIMPLMMEHQKAMLDTKEEVTGIMMAARKRHLNTIGRMYREVITRGDCIAIGDLDITGNDLIEYGLKGPEIGKTLEELLGIVMENPKLNDKATLVALIEHLK
jgi:tRNA nucleotidyltransferase (CCA-adding enzyme)